MEEVQRKKEIMHCSGVWKEGKEGKKTKKTQPASGSEGKRERMNGRR